MNLVVHKRCQCLGQAVPVLKPCGNEGTVNKGMRRLILAFTVGDCLLAGINKFFIVLCLKQRPYTVKVAQVPMLVIFLKGGGCPFLESACLVIEIRRYLFVHILPF